MRNLLKRLSGEGEAVTPARNAIWNMFRSVEKRYPKRSSLTHSELIREILIDIKAEDVYLAQYQLQPDRPFVCRGKR